MNAGQIIILPDGRECTVVYHGLDGYGVVFGRQAVDVAAILAANPLFGRERPGVPQPEAMLRDPYPGAEVECVGTEYEIALDTKGSQNQKRSESRGRDKEA